MRATGGTARPPAGDGGPPVAAQIDLAIRVMENAPALPAMNWRRSIFVVMTYSLIYPTLFSGKVLSSSATPFHETWMPMQNNKNGDTGPPRGVPVTPINCASRGEFR